MLCTVANCSHRFQTQGQSLRVMFATVQAHGRLKADTPTCKLYLGERKAIIAVDVYAFAVV